MLAFRPQHETIQPARLPNRVELLVSACQQFVYVGLMAHIENETVLRRLENVVHGKRQLYHPKIRSDVPARPRYSHNQPLADLCGKLRQLRNCQLLHVCRRLDPA